MREPPEIASDVLAQLIRDGSDSWDEFRALAADRHQWFIPCDHVGAYHALRELRSRAATFLELGSAAGVVTVMASLLGYEAYGIECEPWLVERSFDLAERFGSTATFAEGSFVPPAYRDEIEHLDANFLAVTDDSCAYDELGLELDDFDLVYAYPWPGEEEWLAEMVRRHAREDALLLTYDVAEGFRVSEE